jgi:hypothetical protein
MADRPSNHLYHAHALAVAGKVVRPNQAALPPAPTATLSPIGGYSSARAEDFELKGVISIKSAFAEVAGSYDEINSSHTTLSSVVLEGVNIQNVVTADRIVVRLAARHCAVKGKGSSEPRIVPTGSHFENLRVAGRPVDVELDTGLFCKHDTFSSVLAACADPDHPIHSCLLANQLGAVTEDIHPRLFHFAKGLKDLPTDHSMYWYSLAYDKDARSAKDAQKAQAQDKTQDAQKTPKDPERQSFGSVIYVPHFGSIHLAELIIEKNARRLNMLRIHMGSPIEGDMILGSAFSNGTTYPPTSGGTGGP